MPIVVSGAAPESSVTLRLTADYGRLFYVARERESAFRKIESAADQAGKSLTLPGQQEEVNRALESVLYAPPANWNSIGQDTFETLSFFAYNDEDGEPSSDEAWTLLVRVTPVNDPPSLRGPADVIALESRTTVVRGIEVDDVDAHERHEVVEVTASVGQEGSLVELGTEMGLYVTQSSPQRKTFLGSVESVNEALAGLTYRGPSEFSGRDELLVTVDDRGNTGEGGSFSDSLVTSILVSSVNDPPRVMREGELLVRGVEDEAIVLAGVTVEDADAGGARVKLMLEARFGTVSVSTEDDELEFLEGDGVLDARVTVVGTIQVKTVIYFLRRQHVREFRPGVPDEEACLHSGGGILPFSVACDLSWLPSVLSVKGVRVINGAPSHTPAPLTPGNPPGRKVCANPCERLREDVIGCTP